MKKIAVVTVDAILDAAEWTPETLPMATRRLG